MDVIAHYRHPADGRTVSRYLQVRVPANAVSVAERAAPKGYTLDRIAPLSGDMLNDVARSSIS